LLAAKEKIVEEDARVVDHFFPSTSAGDLPMPRFAIMVDVHPITMALKIEEREGVVTFGVRVAPRASRDAIEGEYDGSLKVRLTAPPVDDQANHALRRLLAARLNVPLGAVRIVAGEKNRSKRVAVAGITAAEVIWLAAQPSQPKR
jgi:uncharacterized protein